MIRNRKIFYIIFFMYLPKIIKIKNIFLDSSKIKIEWSNLNHLDKLCIFCIILSKVTMR